MSREEEEEPDLRAYHPDHKPVGKNNGLYCFQDVTRPCGADCMAFQSERPNGPDYAGQQWANCMLLTNLHKGAKHLVILAQGVGALVNHQQDKARAEQQAPSVHIPKVGR